MGLSEIEGVPANLVAISPQLPDKSVSTKEGFKLDFEVLSDVSNKVAKRFNLVYRLPDYLLKTYQGFGVDVEDYNGKQVIDLPIPATYIVDRSGKIQGHFVNTRSNERVGAEDVVRKLRRLNMAAV